MMVHEMAAGAGIKGTTDHTCPATDTLVVSTEELPAETTITALLSVPTGKKRAHALASNL